jgi:hypothetical protein
MPTCGELNAGMENNITRCKCAVISVLEWNINTFKHNSFAPYGSIVVTPCFNYIERCKSLEGLVYLLFAAKFTGNFKA